MNVTVPEYRSGSEPAEIATTVHTSESFNFGRYLAFINTISYKVYLYNREPVSQLFIVRIISALFFGLGSNIHVQFR